MTNNARLKSLSLGRPSKSHPARLPADSELAMQLECCQTEVEFVRRRLKQTEEKLETERQSREQLDTKVRRDTGTCAAALMGD